MNSQHAITAENLMLALPDVLRNDESISALAVSVAGVLAQRVAEINSILIYSRIDELPGDLLDILAHDFKVDWWDADYTLEEKRKTLKDSWYVHRHVGTKAAVEKAMSAIYDDVKVVEWFEYGGEPYHFKLIIASSYENADAEKYNHVLNRLEVYKNLRSVLEGVLAKMASSQTNAYVGLSLWTANTGTVLSNSVDLNAYTRLQDEQSVVLTDELGYVALE